MKDRLISWKLGVALAASVTATLLALATVLPAADEPVMCCIDGHVVAKKTIQDCVKSGGGGLLGPNIHVGDPCGPSVIKCKCCVHGKIIMTTLEQCNEKHGTCYGSEFSEKEAAKRCAAAQGGKH